MLYLLFTAIARKNKSVHTSVAQEAGVILLFVVKYNNLQFISVLILKAAWLKWMAVCVCGLIKKSTIFASRKQMLSTHGTLGAPT